MKKIHYVIGPLALLGMAAIVFFVLRSEFAVTTHPKGVMARSELELIATNILLMLIVIVPTFLFLLRTVWKYRAKNGNAKYDPGPARGIFRELILWIIPSPVIAVMAVHTWNATHKLDPYRPLGGRHPLEIRVVALDWKWLFIYPEQGIATVNFVQFPRAHLSPLQARGRRLSDELVLDPAAQRADLRHDGDDHLAPHHGRRPGGI